MRTNAKPRRFRWLVGFAIALLLCAVLHAGFQAAHTFTLAACDEATKPEHIQPLCGTVTVSADWDTDVVFTDLETGETHTIGYLTHGMTERIPLTRGHWYAVAGNGPLTLHPVNIRIE